MDISPYRGQPMKEKNGGKTCEEGKKMCCVRRYCRTKQLSFNEKERKTSNPDRSPMPPKLWAHILKLVLYSLHCWDVFFREGVCGIGDEHTGLAHSPVAHYHTLNGTAR